jgi:hypothetical protein
MFPVAFDYKRFSDPSQAEGDSTRRQESLSDAWSERTGIPIDATLKDEGVSGMDPKRRTDERYGLACFLKVVQAGRVQPGDYLLLENLDRLSREEEVPATHLLTSILIAGIKVVQLAPYELELTAKSDVFTIFRAVLELSRGHGESARKCQLIGASYAHNRTAASLETESYQGMIPLWLERVGDAPRAKARTIRLVPERVEVVRLIYRLAAQGWGYARIVARLNDERIPTFSDRTPLLTDTGAQARGRAGRLRWKAARGRMQSGRWTKSYVVSILRGRAAVGELHTKTGEIIPVPAAVTEEEWLAAQAGRTERNKCRDRTRKTGKDNLWQSLLTDAETGTHLYGLTRYTPGKSWRVLVSAAAAGGHAKATTFPEAHFEDAMLSCFKEIDPAEVTRQEGPDQVAILSGQLEQVRGQLAKLEAELKTYGDEAPRRAVRVMKQLEDEEARLEEERRQAQQAAATPLSEAWGQTLCLLDAAKTVDERLRLRTLLRRIVESVHVLIVARGWWDRVAAVQMRFKGSDKPRGYLLVYRRGGRFTGRDHEDMCDVIALDDFLGLGTGYDLRDSRHVSALRAKLEALDLSEIRPGVVVPRAPATHATTPRPESPVS